jgi:predicted nucleotidyltransferase
MSSLSPEAVYQLRRGELILQKREARRRELRAKAESVARTLVEEFGATRVRLFGSLQRPWFHEESDIDLAVEGIAEERRTDAQDRALAMAETNVDLVFFEDAPPLLRVRILSVGEIHALSEVDRRDTGQCRPAALAREIETARSLLRQLADEVDAVQHRHPELVPREALALIAVDLHSYYTKLEALLERILVSFEGQVPRGESGHAGLIRIACMVVPGVRPNIVRADIRGSLDELRKFRHFFRHAYALDLRSDKLARFSRCSPALRWPSIRI